jgi:hypothetical protein
MHDPVYQLLRELGWKRQLTEAEQARLLEYLKANPEAQDDWLLESHLNQALKHLPNTPVSSNFTARVLQAIELENKIRERSRQKGWHFGRLITWFPKASAAAFILGVGAFSFYQVKAHDRTVMVRNVVALSQAVSASDPELMENFDLIHKLSDPQAGADHELLVLLK